MDIRTLLMTNRATRRVHEALELIRAVAPEIYDHFFREITQVVLFPGACGDGVACTSGPFQRQVVLTHDPEDEDLVELAVTLVHESLHHGRDQYGQPLHIEHTCQDCRDPIQRLLDPIYQADEALRQAIHTHLRSAAEKSERPSLIEGLFRAAAVGVLVVGGIALLGSIFEGKHFDPTR